VLLAVIAAHVAAVYFAIRATPTLTVLSPEPAGIAWKRPVLDHTPEGMLIIHLGERCVILPPLPMVFCKIGWMH